MRNWSQREVTNPRGAWTADSLVHKGTPSRASFAQNMRFFPGMTYSREGTSNVLAVSAAVQGIYDWLGPSNPPFSHYVAYMSGGNIHGYQVATATDYTLLGSVTGAAPSFAELGPRLYFTTYDSSAIGQLQAHVFDGSFTNGPADVDSCFRAPLQFTSSSASDGGAGQCTQGTHFIGFIFQSRSGFAGLPSPVDNSMIFQPLSVTLNAGLRQISVSITLNTPTDAGTNSAIFPIITRADNPNLYYFVPDVFAVLPYNTPSWTQTFTISVSDEDLAASAEPATNQFNVLTQDLSGNGPFKPQAVVGYGLRMCYLSGNQAYFSEINDPQMLAADLNVVQMQNQRKIPAGAPLGQSFMFYGDKWTGSVTDNGDEPATWPQPSLVSDSLGAAYPNLLVSKTAGAYHWVITEFGVYLFDGSYQERPITYLESDNWKRINWNYAYTIQAADDIANQRLYVAVPLDSATAPNFMFCIDYTNGKAYDACDISLDTYFGGGTFQSLAMVKESSTNRTALWIGPSGAGEIVHADPTVVNDSGTAIHALWESSYVRDGSDPIVSRTVRVGGADLWVKGSGTLLFTAFGMDRTTQCGPDYLALSSAPGQELFSQFDLNPTENYTFRFETNGVNDSFQLSGFRSYTKPSLYKR